MQVTIGVTRRTQYASIVEMTEAEFTRLSGLLESGDRRVRRAAEDHLNTLINVSDWQDDELHGVDTFEITT